MRSRALAALAAALLSPATALALSQPLRVNFQGKLLDPATNLPKTGTVSLTFNVYQAPTGGTSLYTETQNGVPLTNGVFAVQIGATEGLPRDLFLGASAYLGVTVVGDAGGEMSPRQSLAMSPYAFTANQLSDSSDVRLVAGPTYSTFTSAGNLLVPGGVAAATAAFSGSGPTVYSLTTSSGIQMNAGTLDVTGTAGIRADDTGLTVSTIDLVGLASEPAGNAGYLYYNSSTGSIKVFDGSGQWNYVFGQSLSRQSFVTTDNTAATAAKAAAGTILVTPFYLPGPMMVNSMRVRVTTALGAAGDIGVYDSAGNLLLNGGSSSLTTTAGAKTVTPTQTGNARFLPPGQYYAAVTWNSTTGVVGGNNLTVAGLVNRVGTVLGGGLVLPASISPTAITAGTIEAFFEINP